LSPIAAFLGGEIEGLVRFPVPPIPVPRGVLPDRDQGQALWQARIAAPNSRAQSSDVTGKVPPSAILVDAHSMARGQMSSEHLAARAAF